MRWVMSSPGRCNSVEALSFKGRVWVGMGFLPARGKTHPHPGPRLRGGRPFPLKGKETSKGLPRREGEAFPLHRNPGVPMKASHFALPLALLIALPSLAATRGFEGRDTVNPDRY